MYLTFDEYIARSYESETERMASEHEKLDGLGDKEKGIVLLCIKDASSAIDNYLRDRYRTPLSPVADSIKRICFQLSRFHLFEKKNILNEEAFLVYDRAIAELKKIAKGDIKLDAIEAKRQGSSKAGRISYVKGKSMLARAEKWEYR